MRRRRGSRCEGASAASRMLSGLRRLHPAPPSAAARALLPAWMRLYFYGMHGLTLDVLASSCLRLLRDAPDRRMLGFSSPSRCLLHSLSHFALERLYLRGQGAFASRFLFFPSVYVGLQLLLRGALGGEPELSALYLALLYGMAVYHSQVFLKRFLQLRYRPGGGPERGGCRDVPGERGNPPAMNQNGGLPPTSCGEGDLLPATSAAHSAPKYCGAGDLPPAMNQKGHLLQNNLPPARNTGEGILPPADNMDIRNVPPAHDCNLGDFTKIPEMTDLPPTNEGGVSLAKNEGNWDISHTPNQKQPFPPAMNQDKGDLLPANPRKRGLLSVNQKGPTSPENNPIYGAEAKSNSQHYLNGNNHEKGRIWPLNERDLLSAMKVVVKVHIPAPINGEKVDLPDTLNKGEGDLQTTPSNRKEHCTTAINKPEGGLPPAMTARDGPLTTIEGKVSVGFAINKGDCSLPSAKDAPVLNDRDAFPPMSVPGLPDPIRFTFFGMHGFLDEIIFTSIFNLLETPRGTLSGHTSIWSFFMYGSCSFVVEKLYFHLYFKRGWGARRRLPLYILVIYTWELTWGLLLRKCSACSWDYSHYPLNFMGLITLMYLPGWIFLSIYQDLLFNVLLHVQYRRSSQRHMGL